jgi:RNA polymerase sigma factor (sigma-70 family)
MSFAQSAAQRAPARSDDELVAEARQGSDGAFGDLYVRYRSRIRAYVLGMIGDHGWAEDVVQEVFISALRRLRNTDTPIAFKPWIYEIAKNACIDEFRRLKRTQEVPLEPRDETDVGAGRIGVTPAPEFVMENKERIRDLRWAFYGLSENHHRVIVMREFEGLSYGQIGQRMGMSKPIVESTLFRARRRLSQEYTELVTGRRCEDVQSAIASEGERPLNSLGLRQRRQLARHLAHCQPCRRAARLAGVDGSFFEAPTLADKIGALLLWPWLRSRRSQRNDDCGPGAGANPSWSLRPLEAATRFADSAAPLSGLGRAAATAAALVVTGAGGSIVTGLTNQGDAKPKSVQALAKAAAIASARAQAAHPSTSVSSSSFKAPVPSSAAAGGRGATGASEGGAGSSAPSSGTGAVQHAGTATRVIEAPSAAGRSGAAHTTGATGGNVSSTATGTGSAVGGLVGAPAPPGLPKLKSGANATPTPIGRTPTGSTPAVSTPTVSPPVRTPPVSTPPVSTPTPAVPTGPTGPTQNPLGPIPKPTLPAVNVKVPHASLPSFSVPNPGRVPTPAPSGITPPLGPISH